MNVLVAGGAGYIGSHTVKALRQAGHAPVIYDNLSRGHRAVAQILRVPAVWADLSDAAALVKALREHQIQCVMHFAAFAYVGESVEQPLAYYDNNVAGTLRVLEAMEECGVNTLVFSSSATVYGDPIRLPLTEDHPLSTTNPYGRMKLMIEEILRDLHRSDPSWKIGILRYFNPAGAHASGLIGEDPQGVPNNLLPVVAQVAVERRVCLNVWGNDYSTPDGTGVRDYIHVVDLALGHLKALKVLEGVQERAECLTVNLGTGRGYSVLDIVRAFEQASGRAVPYKVAPRRPGDVASCYANPQRAFELLDWRAERGIDAMCADAWRWQSGNPNGFKN